MLKQDLLIPLKDGDIDAANAASLTGKLLQMSNGAVYDENGKARVLHDHKLEALEDLIEAANGQSVLVAYWFKHDRERIINHLEKLKIPVRDIKTSTDIKDWNAGKIPVALIHPASAGHGLNIQQGGHILIWFGLTWSLELYQQTNIARRFGVRMGNAEERAFITGDGVGKPLGLLAETGGAKVGVKAAKQDAVTFDEIFKLYYALKAPYRKKAQFLCNEALVLQLMTIKDNNGNYIWKPGLEIGKPDTLLNRPLKTSAFMPEIKGGNKVMAFGDYCIRRFSI